MYFHITFYFFKTISNWTLVMYIRIQVGMCDSFCASRQKLHQPSNAAAGSIELAPKCNNQ